ncbi:MAG: hypothetical protein RMJ33_13035 [Saprospiraceae bacterium]|nr:hypothetical protein [Saprospiraceae bacterium]MDW8230753.1 hypothetical protein [Saprospiraceae bacterium]
MKLHISPEKTIQEVQEAFKAEYPYLQLSFFTQPHRAFKGSPAEYLVKDARTKLSALMSEAKSGFVELPPDLPTFEAETLLERVFGLHVQVMRKSGDTWLVTSATDRLTLAEQNARGRASEHPDFLPSDEEFDYREQE